MAEIIDYVKLKDAERSNRVIKKYEPPEITISRKEIFEKVSKETGIYESDLATVFNAVESAMQDLLTEATPEHSIKLKIFKGYSISSYYRSKREVVRPLDGKVVVAEPYIIIKGSFTHGFRTKMKKLYRKKLRYNPIVDKDVVSDQQIKEYGYDLDDSED